MATLSLFQKWRSQNFDDLVGQEIVVRTLRNALAAGKPASAYLFCGPRGTGKTSTARILAKALNCEKGPTSSPCGECAACRSIAEGNCLDVLEIDAASHTQVEKIREYIVEKVQFAPAEVRYKVYIIDEVHKLSSASFNALLKTLEEPPAHVVFILATTHPQDLLPTILSRCQRYDFRRFTLAQIAGRLAYIAEQEGLTLDSEAAELIGRAADGSLRDALVSLEQALTFCGRHIDAPSVRELLGLAGLEAMQNLVSALINKDSRGAIETLDGIIGNGRDLQKLASELLEYLRRLMLVSVKAADGGLLEVSDSSFRQLTSLASSLSLRDLMTWIKAFSDLQQQLRGSGNPRLLWEAVLVKLTALQGSESTADLELRLKKLEDKLKLLEERGFAAVGGGFRSLASPPAERKTDNLSGWKPLPAEAAMPVASEGKAAPVNVKTSEKGGAAVKEEGAVKAYSVQNDTAARSRGTGTAGSAEARGPGSRAPEAEAKREVQEDELGWDALPKPVGPSRESGSESLFSAGELPPERVEKPKAKKGAPPSEIWSKLLSKLKDLEPQLYPYILATTCLSCKSGSIKIQFGAGMADNYRKAAENKALLEKHCSDLMKRPIKLLFGLSDSEETVYKHAVQQVINSFNGRLIDTYANE
ncbi:DNA polymerase III subunit gamma/tau [bacterium]|nr:DNA polymerase III subunit gamma/tau [bacterium]